MGICAPGRRVKVALIRDLRRDDGGGAGAVRTHGVQADPWMTLVGYFNSMRELARHAAPGRGRREEPLAPRRPARSSQAQLCRIVQELTSRISATDIRPLLDRMKAKFDPHVDAGVSSCAERGSVDSHAAVAVRRDSGHQHDLGGRGRAAAGPDGCGGATEDHRGVHPGHQPRGPQPSGTGCARCTTGRARATYRTTKRSSTTTRRSTSTWRRCR